MEVVHEDCSQQVCHTQYVKTPKVVQKMICDQNLNIDNQTQDLLCETILDTSHCESKKDNQVKDQILIGEETSNFENIIQTVKSFGNDVKPMESLKVQDINGPTITSKSWVPSHLSFSRNKHQGECVK